MFKTEMPPRALTLHPNKWIGHHTAAALPTVMVNTVPGSGERQPAQRAANLLRSSHGKGLLDKSEHHPAVTWLTDIQII